MAKRVNTNIPPTMLMFDSRSGTNARDNGSTVTFNIPQGMDSVTETQTALIQLVDFQASNSFYNITNSNNTLEVFVGGYDTGTIWLPGVAYTAGTIVTVGSYLYRALVDHTSSAKFVTDTDKWQFFIGNIRLKKEPFKVYNLHRYNNQRCSFIGIFKE